MRGLGILVLLFAALASPASAQRAGGSPFRPPPSIPLDKLIEVRAKLIKEYVLEKHLAWGVSVCGEQDVFGNEDSWLTVYVYEDSVVSLPLVVDDIRIRTEKIARRKH